MANCTHQEQDPHPSRNKPTFQKRNPPLLKTKTPAPSAGHEGERAGPGGGPQGRRHNPLVQRPEPDGPALRAGDRGHAQRRDPRSRGQPADRQSRLRLPDRGGRRTLAARLQRLRLRELGRLAGGRAQSAAAGRTAHGRRAVAPASGAPRPDGPAGLQPQREVSLLCFPGWVDGWNEG